MKRKVEYDYPEGLSDSEKDEFDKAVELAYEKYTKEFEEAIRQA